MEVSAFRSLSVFLALSDVLRICELFFLVFIETYDYKEFQDIGLRTLRIWFTHY